MESGAIADHGGWCAPDSAYCICGQIFDENHDRTLCRERVPISDAGLISLPEYTLERGFSTDEGKDRTP